MTFPDLLSAIAEAPSRSGAQAAAESVAVTCIEVSEFRRLHHTRGMEICRP